MAYEFKLPDLGEGLTEGEIARWLVTEGQELAEDDPLVEIQTDKTTVEIPSPAAGTVTKILVGEGEIVPVGTVLVVIGGDGSEPAAAPTPAAARPPAEAARVESTQARVQATPVVRRVAQELGVDLAQLSGTGPNGRITEQDVRAAAGGELVLNQHKPSEGRREPVRGVRRQIVEHLTRAHREVPAVTFVEECDFTTVDVTQLVSLALKATAASLQEFPELNARLEGDEIVYLERYDIGVAVQTDQGLVVPVVRGCDTASTEELATEVATARRLRACGNAQAGGAARQHVHDHERREARRPHRDAARQPSRGRHPRNPPDRPAPRRRRRRDRHPPDRQRLGHVRPPRCRRSPGGGVHTRRHPPPPGLTRQSNPAPGA